MRETRSAEFHNKIATLYDSNYKNSYWQLYGQIEWHKLRMYLPKKKSRILDAGGGTGEFSLEFAKMGHDIVLTDVSSGMLNVARTKIKQKHLENKITVIKQDLTNMKDINDNYFDFAVSLGDPVSYCGNAQKAIKELARVTKKDSYVFITVDSFYATLVRLTLTHDLKGLDKLLKTHISTFDGKYEQYNFTPEELKVLFNKAHLEIVDIFSLTNLVNGLPRNELIKLLDNKNYFNKILEIELKYSSEPSLVGFGRHLGVVGRRL